MDPVVYIVGLVFMSASLKSVPFPANIFPYHLLFGEWIKCIYTVACSAVQCLVQGFVAYKVVYNEQMFISSYILQPMSSKMSSTALVCGINKKVLGNA